MRPPPASGTESAGRPRQDWVKCLADLIWEAPDEFTAEHAQAFRDAMRAHLAGDSDRAGQLWENLRAIWSHAWSANYAVLEFMQARA